MEVESAKAEEARQAVGKEVGRLWTEAFAQLQPRMPPKVSTRWAQTATSLNVADSSLDLDLDLNQ